MKIFYTFLFSLLIITNITFAGSSRWLEVNDTNTKATWFVDSRTLQINDNKTISFWAKVIINNPKYDIVEIKLKYLLSADKLQLTKLQEIGYNNKNEILWNNNLTKNISLIPGSDNEKLVLFIEDYLQQKAEADKKAVKEQEKTDKAAKAATENISDSKKTVSAEPNQTVKQEQPAEANNPEQNPTAEKTAQKPKDIIDTEKEPAK